MRGVVAAVLLACVGTGCCKTCGWCRDDAPPTGSNYTATPATTGTPTATAPSTAPPAPAGRPVGAYGGTVN